MASVWFRVGAASVLLPALVFAQSGSGTTGNSDEGKRNRKLEFEDRVEIVRGLMAEYGKAKVILPRAKKALEVTSAGNFDAPEWEAMAKEFGYAARTGDEVQITKVEIDGDRLVLEINGGAKKKRKWYEGIELGTGNRTSPVARGEPRPAPTGTSIALVFDGRVPALPATEYKKLLAPVIDFSRRSATEEYLETLPPDMKAAIQDKRVVEGMDRDQVIMAVGKPRLKQRETKEGEEYEDWIYGQPPGRMTFVTFLHGKVVKVKESYAGLGGSTAPPLTPR